MYAIKNEKIDTCFFCRSKKIIKYGKDPQGRKKFKCKDCGKIQGSNFYRSFNFVNKKKLELNKSDPFLEILRGFK